MKAKELNKKLREILERNDVRFKLRYVKSKSYGECHGHFIALYGDFVTESSIDKGHKLQWTNDNLWYSARIIYHIVIIRSQKPFNSIYYENLQLQED